METFSPDSCATAAATGLPDLLLQDRASRFSCVKWREGALAASGLCPDPHVGRHGVSGPWLVWGAGARAPGVCGRMGEAPVQSVRAAPAVRRLSSGSVGDSELGSRRAAASSTRL